MAENQEGTSIQLPIAGQQGSNRFLLRAKLGQLLNRDMAALFVREFSRNHD